MSTACRPPPKVLAAIKVRDGSQNEQLGSHTCPDYKFI